MRFFLNDLYLVALKSGESLRQMWLYVLVGVLVSEALRYTSWAKLAGRASEARPVLAVVAASVVGAVSPLCTYGTVPVVAQMARTRMGMAPVVAFLSASSLMNPQLFALTWGGINPAMALVRLGAVLTFGILAGVLLMRVPSHWIVNPALFAEEAAPARQLRTFGWRDYGRHSCKTLWFVGRYLLAGVVLGAAVEVFVPARWFLKWVSAGQFTGVLIAAAISVPLSACGGGAIPLVRSMMMQGMSSGSALAFFIAGPATRPSPVMALAAVLRPIALTMYLLALLAFSVTAGLLYR